MSERMTLANEYAAGFINHYTLIVNITIAKKNK